MEIFWAAFHNFFSWLDSSASFSGFGAICAVAVLAWAVRFRKRLRSYAPVPWLPLRYLSSLRSDPRLRKWATNPAVLHAVRVGLSQQGQSREPLIALLRRTVEAKGRVLILGEPGCWKSATLEALTFELATRCHTKAMLKIVLPVFAICGAALSLSYALIWLLALIPFFSRVTSSRPLPVLVELRKLRPEESLENYIVRSLINTDGGEWLVDRLRGLAGSGRLVLILDGVNELSRSAQESVESSWDDLFASGSWLSRSSVLISSRELGAPKNLHATNRVLVTDLDDAGVMMCLKFHGSPAVDRDFEKLRSSEMLRQFGIGRNPYWLQMMVESNLFTRNRGALFENFVRTLLRKERKASDPSVDELMEFLAQLSRIMSDAGTVGLDFTTLDEVNRRNPIDLVAVREIAKQSMLVRWAQREKRIEFTHQLIQEFFNAYSFLGNESAILDRVNNYDWWGSFVMLGGLLDEHVIDGVKHVGAQHRYEEFVSRLLQTNPRTDAALLAFGVLCTASSPAAELRHRVTGELGRALEGGVFELAALIALMKVAEDAVLEETLSILQGNGHVDIKRLLLQTFPALNTERVAEIAVSLMSEADLSDAAASAVYKLGEKAVRPLLRRSQELSEPEASALLARIPKIDGDVARVLIEEISNDRSPFHPQAAFALELLDERAVDKLIDVFQLGSANSHERVRHVLVKMGAVSASALVGALIKGDAVVKQNVRIALESIGAAAVGAYRERWPEASAANESVRASLVELMGRTLDPTVVPILESACLDKFGGVRIRAMDALGRIASRKGLARQARQVQGRRNNWIEFLLRSVAEWIVVATAFCIALLQDYPGLQRPMLGGFVFASATILVMLVSRLRIRGHQAGVFVGVVWDILFAYLISLPVFYLLFGEETSFPASSGAAAIAVLALFVTRLILSRFVNSEFRKRILVCGIGEMAQVVGGLRRRRDVSGFEIVCFIRLEEDNERFANRQQLGRQSSISYEPIPPEKVRANPSSLAQLTEELSVDEIVVASEGEVSEQLAHGLADCWARGVPITDVPRFLERETGRVYVTKSNLFSALYFHGNRVSILQDSLIRMLDLFSAVSLFLIVLPILIMSALAIAISDGFSAPIFFRQRRVGRWGKAFDLLKFRTMHLGSDREGMARWAQRDDPRVTRVGKVLRYARIDELPQILNVLRGDMSMVGPRPERSVFVDQLIKAIPFYDIRHCVRPGISGWAQVCYPYGASERDALEKLQYDLYYVKHRSVMFNLSVLVQTVEVVLLGKGAR
jgi:sugar transferase (PEP-CTERM system associated)